MRMHVHLTFVRTMGLRVLWNTEHFALFLSSLKHILQIVLEASMSKSSQVVNCVNVEFTSNISETCLLP